MMGASKGKFRGWRDPCVLCSFLHSFVPLSFFPGSALTCYSCNGECADNKNVTCSPEDMCMTSYTKSGEFLFSKIWR